MKTFINVIYNFTSLPNWYTSDLHDKLVLILSDKSKGKLHGCKFLRDTSNTVRDNWSGLEGIPSSQEMSLRTAKDVCDFICENNHEGTLINIQIWHPTAVTWDDVLHTVHRVTNTIEVSQAIADATGRPVRMSFHIDDIKIGSLNGSIFKPKLDLQSIHYLNH